MLGASPTSTPWVKQQDEIPQWVSHTRTLVPRNLCLQCVMANDCTGWRENRDLERVVVNGEVSSTPDIPRPGLEDRESGSGPQKLCGLWSWGREKEDPRGRVKTLSDGAGGMMVQWLTLHAALTEHWNLDPRTHIRQLKITSNFSCRGSDAHF